MPVPKFPNENADRFPHRVFVSEYITSGAWADSAFPESLMNEGSGMLLAVIEDLLKSCDVEIVSTWDARIGQFPLSHANLNWSLVEEPTQYGATRDELLAQADAALIIAPEFHGLLEQEVRHVEQRANCRSMNCSSAAIALCSDKLKLAQHLEERDIATIQTRPFEFSNNNAAANLKYCPAVIKPRDGAGSQATFLIRAPHELHHFRNKNADEIAAFEFIQQPYLLGRSLSVAALVSPNEATARVFPLCDQCLSNDGRFHYLGSRIIKDVESGLQNAAERLVDQCVQSIPGLRGYVGFDLIEPFDRPGELVLVEINPRITSSYLEYRTVLNAFPYDSLPVDAQKLGNGASIVTSS